MNTQEYQLTPLHRKILKNFCRINYNLLIKKNSDTWSTVSSSRHIYAEYKPDNILPFTLALHSVGEFLGLIKNFHTPCISSDEKYIYIRQDNIDSKDEVVMGQREEHLMVTPTKKVIMPEPDIEFDMSADDLEWLIKQSREMTGAPDFVITASKGNLIYICEDKRNKSSNRIIRRTNIKTNKSFVYFLKTDTIDQVFKSDYRVSMSDERIVQFVNKHIPLTYYFGLEPDLVTTDLMTNHGKKKVKEKDIERYIDL